MIFGNLFKSTPQPIRIPRGLYKCRRCGKQFEDTPFEPYRGQINWSRVGGSCYWNTCTHRCDTSDGTNGLRPEFEVWGQADLIGATVRITFPVEKP